MKASTFGGLLGATVLALTSACCSRACKQADLPPGPAPIGRYATLFQAGLGQYRLARKHGLTLTLPGYGDRAPISHVALFEAYRNVFYLPEELEPVLRAPEGVEYLHRVADQAAERDARRLATICLSIANSKRKFRRDGRSQLLEPFQGNFILYHFD